VINQKLKRKEKKSNRSRDWVRNLPSDIFMIVLIHGLVPEIKVLMTRNGSMTQETFEGYGKLNVQNDL
jgi:hypothetical protein